MLPSAVMQDISRQDSIIGHLAQDDDDFAARWQNAVQSTALAMADECVVQPAADEPGGGG